MARHGRWLSMMAVGAGAWLLSGCAALPDWAQPKGSLADGLTAPASFPRLARPQSADPPGVTLKKPIPPLPPTVAPPPGVEQVSFSPRSAMRVMVRVWVNGRPIFDDEVMQIAGPELRRAQLTLSEPQRSQKMQEILNLAIDVIVDQELVYQDAVRKLEKGNPRGLDKLKELVAEEFDKSLQRLRDAKVPENQIREMEAVARRMMERSLISQEYARSRIRPLIESRIGLEEIREYYEAHKKEFIVDDRIEWQDVFIPLNPNQPTIEELKRFAEDMIFKMRTPDDFNKLLALNEGDSKFRNGEGLGNKRGDIRPVELEEHLFKLEAGQIGPVVAFGTGIHVFRITKKERAGLLPLNDETQKVIRRKLENELADREYRRMVRELRQRAVIQIEKE